MSREPISEERLAALRTMSLAVIVPQSAGWPLQQRVKAEELLALVAPVLHELLDEIGELDADLDDTEDELAKKDARLGRALAELKRAVPAEPEREPVISAVHRERVGDRRWRARWREDGRQKQETFRVPGHARAAYEWLLRQQFQGGAR